MFYCNLEIGIILDQLRLKLLEHSVLLWIAFKESDNEISLLENHILENIFILNNEIFIILADNFDELFLAVTRKEKFREEICFLFSF